MTYGVFVGAITFLWGTVFLPMTHTATVIGVGKIGRKHAKILDAMAGVNLGPVVDVVEKRARAVADDLGTRAAGLEEALETADIAFICTPDDEHVTAAERALDVGVNTFVEKPLATKVSEARQLRNMAAETNGVHMVGHILRFDPRYRAVQEAVNQNKLGRPVSATMDRFVSRARLRRTGAVSPPWFRLGVHDFDLLEWLLGTQVDTVAAEAHPGALSDEKYDVPEAVSVLARLKSGATATFSMGFSLPDGHDGSEVRTIVTGTQGSATIDATNQDLMISDDGQIQSVDTHLWPDINDTPDGALARQDRAYIRTIEKGRDSPVPFAAGHRAIQIAEAVGKAVDKDSRVTVTSDHVNRG